MSDDPRGHDDGDIFSGTPSERSDALDFQFKAFLDDLAATEGYDIDALIGGCNRATQYLRGITKSAKYQR